MGFLGERFFLPPSLPLGGLVLDFVPFAVFAGAECPAEGSPLRLAVSRAGTGGTKMEERAKRRTSV